MPAHARLLEGSVAHSHATSVVTQAMLRIVIMIEKWLLGVSVHSRNS